MKKSIEKRVEELEKRLKPKKKSTPGVIFVYHVHGDDITDEEFEASLKVLDARMAVMIMPRPGDPIGKTAAEQNAEYEAHLKKPRKAGDAERDFVINVVHVKKPGPGSGE